jgi:multimeric flavodoxin WrbA
MSKVKILGISGSLRNARRGLGGFDLMQDLRKISSKEELNSYLKQEAKNHLENFEKAGRLENLPFDQMYTKLKKEKGNKGLSNSEVALAASLWSAKEIGVEIDYLSLSEYYSESGVNNLEELKEKVQSADGIIMSTPVYFGDRGSLVQSFINELRADKTLLKELEHKVFAGIAVGAKRNGGQETALIYQLMDMLNIGMLGVGNDSETTSQYGGTGLAGDIGTMPDDQYGLDTSMGTGRRLARTAIMVDLGKDKQLLKKPRVLFWILQDAKSTAFNFINELPQEFLSQIDANIVNVSEKKIIRCIACDVCPTHIDIDEEYRCIIKSKNDDLSEIHENLLDYDAIIPVIYSNRNEEEMVSNYQRFIERTRYLRRGDYVFSDIVVAPLIIEEIGTSDNMHIRTMTSMIRHHTVMSKPLIANILNGDVLNNDSLSLDLDSLLVAIKNVSKGRLVAYSQEVNHLKYNPVGYVLSAVKDREDEKMVARKNMIENRIERVKKIKNDRIK